MPFWLQKNFLIQIFNLYSSPILIIEVITGESYADFVQENIFDKVGMKNSYYGSKTKLIKNRATIKIVFVNSFIFNISLSNLARNITKFRDLSKSKFKDHDFSVYKNSIYLFIF